MRFEGIGVQASSGKSGYKLSGVSFDDGVNVPYFPLAHSHAHSNEPV